MTNAALLLRASLAAACALALGGCLSMLGGKPANLYRFGQPAAAEAAAAPAGAVGVFRANGTFQREASGDRLLTLTDGKAAYVAETRWVAPASVLWEQAVLAAFDADPGRARLVARGEAASADYVLRLDVRNFETRYENGRRAPPTVLVRVRAAMTRGAGKEAVAEEIFEARIPAAGNRVSLIVDAYDRAVADVLGRIVAWTNTQAQPIA